MISRSAIQISGLFSFCLLLACNSQTELNQLEHLHSPATNNASLPYLVVGNDGNLFMSWVEQTGDTTIFKYATLKEDSFGAVETIASGTDWFVNWADYPMMAVNQKGDMIAHFLAKSSEGTYAYDVNVVTKLSDQSVWSEPIIPHSDSTPTEHGFVTMLPQPDNSFMLAWLDGRNMGEMDHDSHVSGSNRAMTLRKAVISPSGEISDEAELDGRVCDCCQTTGVMTENGPTFFYRDRSEHEIRDISYVRKQGTSWLMSETVHNDNWKINGYPVNGPRADNYGSIIALAWFSAPKNKGMVQLAFSQDNGVTFDSPIAIDSMSPLGRVDVVMVSENKAVVSWLAKEGSDVVIKAQPISTSGVKQGAITIGKTSEARGSGFPQMAWHKGKLYFAWTDFGEDSSSKVLLKTLNFGD